MNNNAHDANTYNSDMQVSGRPNQIKLYKC